MTTANVHPISKVVWDDLGDVIEGDVHLLPTGTLFREDGVGLVYPGKVNAFIGETESGKTMAALRACVAHMEGGGVVFYLDFEMDRVAISAQLLLVGASPSLVRERFRYANWPEDVGARVNQIARFAEAGRDVLVVLDSVDEFLLSAGVSPNDQEAGSRLQETFAKPLKPVGVTVVFIDHVSTSKEGQAKRGAAGSFRKLANVDSALKFKTKLQPRPGALGKVDLYINKDRPGTLRASSPTSSGAGKEQHFGTMVLDSTKDANRIVFSFEAPAGSANPLAGQEGCIEVLRVWGALDADTGMKRPRSKRSWRLRRPRWSVRPRPRRRRRMASTRRATTALSLRGVGRTG